MNKAELIKVIQKELGKDVSNAAAERALNAVLKAIQKGVRMDGKVQLVGFGHFRISHLRARSGRNPKTGVSIQVKPSKTVRFRAGLDLRESL